MDEREKVLEIIGVLREKYPKTTTALGHHNPLELLIATILSAQCTDKRVNIVTKDLFRRYKTAEDYANSDLKELEQYIKSTGFYKNKAKNIRNCCKMLVDRFGSKVPNSMDKLITLPGVARKTANIVLSHGFGIAEGIAVDTHVSRVAPRLGLSDKKDPKKIEQDLMKVVPKENWIDFSSLLIMHGRETCKARKPDCGRCGLNRLCPSAGKFS
ncbi:MAG: endonuclease III [Candidatus Altiarchaeota archaeon]|nr:endonuclease III [Candidatus Altiarchaeota archaeon]